MISGVTEFPLFRRRRRDNVTTMYFNKDLEGRLADTHLLVVTGGLLESNTIGEPRGAGGLQSQAGVRT